MMPVQEPSAVRDRPQRVVGLGLAIFFGALVGLPSLLLAVVFCQTLLASGITWAVRDVRIGTADCREFVLAKDLTPLRVTCPAAHAQ